MDEEEGWWYSGGPYSPFIGKYTTVATTILNGATCAFTNHGTV